MSAKTPLVPKDKADVEGGAPFMKESLRLTPYTWTVVKSHPDINSRSTKTINRAGFDCLGGREKKSMLVELESDVDTMTYDIQELASWSAFCMMRGSAWDNRGLWKQLAKAFLLATTVAVVIVFCTPDPTSVRSNRFAKLSTFLSVFVGLLLSFFMSSSMMRWYKCVGAFLELFDAVRNLQMQCHALGVCREREELLTRYGVLSAWLLHLQLVAMAKDDSDETKAMETVWVEIMTNHPGLCHPEEKELLMQAYEPAQTVWTWVASLVGRMALDGDIPPMSTPTYGRILNIVQNAHSGIREVRAAVCVQAPFIYIHTLAVLVHFNNVINAISFGLTSGVSMAKFVHIPHDISERHQERMYAREAQNLIIAFFLSMLGPFLYQALLEVSVCIAQPFNKESDSAMIPTVRLLKCLERDLCECDYLSRHTPGWETPCFRPKPEEAAKK
mmetsp:Transcript_5442/g.14705  ORF Transcript_5442/g.14705 Transcript_5442/m.14705 type:complete len:444 (-) Transcript_5442:41-1372(-)